MWDLAGGFQPQHQTEVGMSSGNVKACQAVTSSRGDTSLTPSTQERTVTKPATYMYSCPEHLRV